MKRELRFENATLVMWFGLAIIAVGFFAWLATRTGASGMSLVWVAVMAVGLVIAVAGEFLRRRAVPHKES